MRHGLASTFKIKCTCGHNNEIKTSQEHRSGKHGPAAFDVNTRIALGCLHVEMGQRHLNNLLSTTNIPTLNWTVVHITKISCEESLQIEKAMRNGTEPDENQLLRKPPMCGLVKK